MKKIKQSLALTVVIFLIIGGASSALGLQKKSNVKKVNEKTAQSKDDSEVQKLLHFFNDPRVDHFPDLFQIFSITKSKKDEKVLKKYMSRMDRFKTLYSVKDEARRLLELSDVWPLQRGELFPQRYDFILAVNSSLLRQGIDAKVIAYHEIKYFPVEPQVRELFRVTSSITIYQFKTKQTGTFLLTKATLEKIMQGKLNLNITN